MLLTAVLLRWYRSFNVRTLGPADALPGERWNAFRNELFPFVRVPLDRLISTVVGANESGKSHLLSAITKVTHGVGLFGAIPDRYEIKDVCRYCGFDAMDDVWPEIGLELSVDKNELPLFEGAKPPSSTPSEPVKAEAIRVAIILNGGMSDRYATAYLGDTPIKTFTQDEWRQFADEQLPRVSILESDLALPNEIHIDELLDLYRNEEPRDVVDGLSVQDLWRNIASIKVVHGPIDQATAQRVDQLKDAISKSARRTSKAEQRLVHLLFSGVLGIESEHLDRMRKYTNSERGYVSWINDEINSRIDRVLDISQYWDQDEDFHLSVNYKAGTFHFEITDRTGSTYTFNERSSGLKYFLSYYIQAKALENSQTRRGVVILMDEPDNFLSASGQRSLLRVFESLVSNKTVKRPCQLIYTTHSPFLINRNFPTRVRLVRKGDGTEGTQHVERPAVRRFEPVRTALSIDSSDTLFLGSINVVLEGGSDQKLLTSCIQRFGEPGRLDEVLDLNRITLVGAGGAPYAVELVRKALKGDEKPPVVVVLLDGDASGEQFARVVAEYVDKKQVATLKEVEGQGSAVFQVLEDLVPVALLDRAIQKYLSRLGLVVTAQFDGSVDGENHAKKIVNFCKVNVAELKSYDNIEIRDGVIDSLVELLEDEEFYMAQLEELKRNSLCVCAHINQMIEHAERVAGQHSLKKIVRHHVDTFLKRFPESASKADIARLLNDIGHSAFGRAHDFVQTRGNVDQLLARLNDEAKQNSDRVDREAWRLRLERFKNQPWAKVTNWGTVAVGPGSKGNQSPVAGANSPTADGEELAH